MRWHVAQMLSQIRLEPKERSKATALLWRYLQDKSAIVVVEAMQTLVDDAQEDRHLENASRRSSSAWSCTARPRCNRGLASYSLV